MCNFLFFISILVFLIGVGLFSQGKTVFHEIEAGILFIISAVYFSGGCIVYEIADLRKDHKEQRKINDDLRKLRLSEYHDKTESEVEK